MVKIPEERLTGAQLRAARALLNWSAQDLADASKVSLRTIRRAEIDGGPLALTAANRAAITSAFERQGIRFGNTRNEIGVWVTR